MHEWVPVLRTGTLGQCCTNRGAHRPIRVPWAALQELLEVCGRSHTLYDAYAAIEALHAAGPPTWSLDLMSG